MNKTISLLVFLTLVSCSIFSSNKSTETDDGLTKKKRSGSVSVKDRVMSDESDGFGTRSGLTPNYQSQAIPLLRDNRHASLGFFASAGLG